MAHKKAAASTTTGRESESKRLGVKIYGGQIAIGKDHTLYALTDGVVEFRRRRGNKSYVSVIPAAEA